MVGKVTMLSMGLWLIRDVLTMAGAFILPERLSRAMQKRGVEEDVAETSSQFLCPVLG